jgi:hypothetical protein
MTGRDIEWLNGNWPARAGSPVAPGCGHELPTNRYGRDTQVTRPKRTVHHITAVHELILDGENQRVHQTPDVADSEKDLDARPPTRTTQGLKNPEAGGAGLSHEVGARTGPHRL